MRRTEWHQETRLMRFEDAYEGWTSMRLTQIDAAQLLGVCPRTFRRTINRYEEDGLDGLFDKRLAQVSHRRAPVDEVMRLVDRYRKRRQGWNVQHYTAWVKNTLQQAGVVNKAPKRGVHRKRRERTPGPA